MSDIECECIICYETMKTINKITFANCRHGNRVHAECILRWNSTCPICRAEIYNRRHTVLNIQNNIDYYNMTEINEQLPALTMI